MDDALHILVADYVPVANKGEEAIVRGIEDMLSEGRPVEIGLFDDVPQVTRRGNITVFPRDWVFRFEGNPALSGRSRVLMQAWIALQLRVGAYGPLNNLTPGGAAECRTLQEFFERARYVLVGHDGVFCVESCRIIHLAKKHGKRTGILGASTGIAGGRFYKAGLYRRTMEESDFCIFREEHSCESMRQVCRDPAKLMVAPDPAFAMRPDPPEAARRVLERESRYCQAKQAGRPIVAVTALEKGRVYAGFRPDLRGPAKQQAHAAYLATILDNLVAKHGAFVLFLPHSVEETGSDIVAARNVAEQMNTAPNDYVILEHDCDARLLKSIVRECDFLVGERTHSLIGGVSVGTPFVAMTNRQDTRTHGIIGQMCDCETQIIDMDVIDGEEAARKVCQLFERRETIGKSLERIRGELSARIDEVVRIIKGS
jgi:polysaccharide pyruvyl transferase WcaK-like protein